MRLVDATIALKDFVVYLYQQTIKSWRQSVVHEMTSTIGFILYTLVVVNVYLLVQPALRLVTYPRTRGVPAGARDQRRIPRWRRRRRDSLDRPPGASEREPRRQLSVPGVDSVSLAPAEQSAAPEVSLKTSTRVRPALSSRPSRITSQSASLLLTRLPLELRQEIYRLVLAGRHKHFIRLGGDDYTMPTDFVLNDADYRTRDTLVPGAAAPPWLWRRQSIPISNIGGSGTSSLLALPLTCRQIYMESVGLLYASVVFKVSRLFTLTDLSVTLLPQRFAAIRTLEISYEFHCGLPLTRGVHIGEDADWASCWQLVHGRMPGLRELRMDLFAFDIHALVAGGGGGGGGDDGGSGGGGELQLRDPVAHPRLWHWLAAMLRVQHLRHCHVKLHHAKRFNDAYSNLLAVSWYMLVVMDALERLLAASMTGRRLHPDAPPFGAPESEKLSALWRTCCELGDPDRRRALGIHADPRVA